MGEKIVGYIIGSLRSTNSPIHEKIYL